ncbi:Fe-S cluster assembly protein SufD [Rosettibacter firmus]|uniref:Fe-S cluster assembly protein SufD n=1 Tax=Rosettibacter firmus TaxID=3111522 RepID=UPI00336BE87B
MNQTNLHIEAKNWYLSNLELLSKKINGTEKPLLHKIREKSIQKFTELNFPTKENEEWKYTDITPILKHRFVPSLIVDNPQFSFEEINKYLFQDFDFYLVTLVNGIFYEQLSNINDLPEGVIIGSLKKLVNENQEILERYLNQFSGDENIFHALNNIYANDGSVIIIDENVTVDKPIQILFINGNDNNEVLSSPRNFIIANKNSKASFIYNYKGFGNQKYFLNSTVNVFIDEAAIVDYYKIQEENENSFHIEKIDVIQKSKSVFNQFNINFGGELVRNDINSKLDGENIETHFYGLYLANGKQHIDNHTFIDHIKPNCISNELYKGILDDESHGVFNGKIFVRPGAQKTNAYQQNKAILLSPNAKVDTKPQLEIFADDVKCTHGAAVGHLDESAEFYIRSRGVPEELAKSILIRAFAYDVIETIKIEELREQINHIIFKHLHRVEIKNQ